MTTSSDPAPRSPTLYRVGLSSARRELQAGTARRHRADVEGTHAFEPRPPAIDDAGRVPGVELATQRAGVRAALAELRRHRGDATSDRSPA